MSHHRDSLTEAETNVLCLVDTGLSNQKIAETMSIAVGTVKSHLHRAYDKLQARNRLEALFKARAQGHLPESVEARGSAANITFGR